MTLVEITVVVLVLLSLISLLFMGARAWKHGADRAGCIVQIRQGQVALRSYANSSGFSPGHDHSFGNLKNAVIGPDQYILAEPACPGDGGYTFVSGVIPEIGTLFMTCSLRDSLNHEPQRYSEW